MRIQSEFQVEYHRYPKMVRMIQLEILILTNEYYSLICDVVVNTRIDGAWTRRRVSYTSTVRRKASWCRWNLKKFMNDDLSEIMKIRWKNKLTAFDIAAERSGESCEVRSGFREPASIFSTWWWIFIWIGIPISLLQIHWYSCKNASLWRSRYDIHLLFSLCSSYWIFSLSRHLCSHHFTLIMDEMATRSIGTIARLMVGLTSFRLVLRMTRNWTFLVLTMSILTTEWERLWWRLSNGMEIYPMANEFSPSPLSIIASSDIHPWSAQFSLV